MIQTQLIFGQTTKILAPQAVVFFGEIGRAYIISLSFMARIEVCRKVLFFLNTLSVVKRNVYVTLWANRVESMLYLM